MTKGVALRAYVAPQRLEGETKRHYLSLLDRQIKAYRKIRDDNHNTREKRNTAARKYKACVRARDRCLTGREK